MTSSVSACSRCQTRLPGGAKFCTACGHEQPIDAEFTEAVSADTGEERHAQRLQREHWQYSPTSPSQSPTPGPAGRDPDHQRPWYRKVWGVLLLVAGVLLIGIIMIGALSDDPTDAPDSNASAANNQSGPLPIIVDETGPTPSPTVQPSRATRGADRNALDMEPDTVPPETTEGGSAPADTPSDHPTTPPDSFAPPPSQN